MQLIINTHNYVQNILRNFKLRSVFSRIGRFFNPAREICVIIFEFFFATAEEQLALETLLDRGNRVPIVCSILKRASVIFYRLEQLNFTSKSKIASEKFSN